MGHHDLLREPLRRASEPLLPPLLFANRVFNFASIVMALTFMGLMGASVFFPLFFQLVMGSSPATSGMLTVPMMAGMIVASSLIGRLVARANKYKEGQGAGLGVADLPGFSLSPLPGVPGVGGLGVG